MPTSRHGPASRSREAAVPGWWLGGHTVRAPGRMGGSYGNGGVVEVSAGTR